MAEERGWFAELDDWCKSRADRVSAEAAAHLNRGLPLNAPDYRTMLGEHRAYLAVRSYIHGTLRNPRPTRKSPEPRE